LNNQLSFVSVESIKINKTTLLCISPTVLQSTKQNLFRDLQRITPRYKGYDSQADFIKCMHFKKFRPTVTKENEAEFNADSFMIY
jgi:hypothetical protein